jgi:hypothetical protein
MLIYQLKYTPRQFKTQFKLFWVGISLFLKAGVSKKMYIISRILPITHLKSCKLHF